MEVSLLRLYFHYFFSWVIILYIIGLIVHDGTGIFQGIESPIQVARYHSLAVQKDSLPECLVVTAETEDGEIMAMRHKDYPVAGLQFHPESVMTPDGKTMIENFIKVVRER